MKKQWVLVCVLAGALMGSPPRRSTRRQTSSLPPLKPRRQRPARSRSAPFGCPKPSPLTANRFRLARTVKVTAQQAAPEAVGTTEALERWAEFSRGKEVKGREVVTIVPQSEIKMVVKDTPPASGTSKVQVLRRERVPPRLVQPRRHALPDALPARGRRGAGDEVRV